MRIGYINGIEYKDSGIEAVYHDEGRLYNSSGTYRREYYISDHLGNVRITFSDLNNNGVIATSGEILQETHYDPFGWRLEGSYINNSAPDNMYQYNGKENNTDHGLNLLDYGARFYNPVIGRFSGVDPIADKFAWVSTYNYAENDPVGNIDLWGLQAVSAGVAAELRLQEVTRNAANQTLTAIDKSISFIGASMDRFINKVFPEGTPPARNYENSGNTIGEGIQEFTNTELKANGTGGTAYSKKSASLLMVDEMLFPNGSGALDYALEDAPVFIRAMNGFRQSIENIDKASDFDKFDNPTKEGIDTIRLEEANKLYQRETKFESNGQTHIIFKPLEKQDDE